MLTENLSTLVIHKLTQEQYERELDAGTIDENALYLTPDEEIDLSIYATLEQLDSKADLSHVHEVADVNGLQSALDELNENKIQLDNGVVPITSGGTGAIDAATALENLFAGGMAVLSNYQYGSELPEAGTVGRLFFKVVG